MILSTSASSSLRLVPVPSGMTFSSASIVVWSPAVLVCGRPRSDDGQLRRLPTRGADDYATTREVLCEVMPLNHGIGLLPGHRRLSEMGFGKCHPCPRTSVNHVPRLYRPPSLESPALSSH